MPYALIFLLTSLLAFLILTEIITVNIFHDGVTVIDVNLIIFAIRYTKSVSTAAENKKYGKRSIAAVPAVFSYLTRIIEKSYIDIREFSLRRDSGSAASLAIGTGVFNSLIAVAVAYAKKNAKKFTSANITYSASEHNNLKLDAKITISLLNFIICTLPFIVRMIGLRAKRLKGKQKIWQKTR